MDDTGLETDNQLDFDVAALGSAVNDEGEAFFSDEEKQKLSGLSKFGGRHGQAKLVKSYLEMESFRGRSIVPPDENASDEDKAKFDAAVNKYRGVPDSPDGYDLVPGEGVLVDEKIMAAYKEHCHKTGKSPAAAQADMDFYNGLMAQARADIEARREQAMAETEKVLLSERKGRHQEISELTKRMLIHATGATHEKDDVFQAFAQEVSESGLGNNLILNRLLGELAQIKEKEGSIDSTTTVTSEKTKDPARALGKALYGKKSPELVR